MHDDIEIVLIENDFKLIRNANVAFDKFEIWVAQMCGDVRAFDLRRVKVVEVVDDGYAPVAFGYQSVNELRADETGTAGHKDVSFH